MIRKIIFFILCVAGIFLLLDSTLWTYFTLAGGEERTAVANGTTTYGAQFVSLMFGFEIPSISIRTWLGILSIGVSIIALFTKKKDGVADTFS